MKTKEQKIARIAAMMAVSNLGHFHNIKPDRLVVDDKTWTGDAYSEVCSIAGHLMENEEHEEYFADEARGWAKTFSDVESIQEIVDDYSHHSEWLLKIMAIPEA